MDCLKIFPVEREEKREEKRREEKITTVVRT
jgi:hypothetical protein